MRVCYVNQLLGGVPGSRLVQAEFGGGLFLGDAQNVGDDLQLSHFVG